MYLILLIFGSELQTVRKNRPGPDWSEGLNRAVFAGFYRSETFFEPARHRPDRTGSISDLASIQWCSGSLMFVGFDMSRCTTLSDISWNSCEKEIANE